MELSRYLARCALVAILRGIRPEEALSIVRSLLVAGADALKLFPAKAGGPAMLRALRAVFPAATRVLPVGGISASNMAVWQTAGAAGYGFGSAIYKPGDTLQTVGKKARRLLAVLSREERSYLSD